MFLNVCQLHLDEKKSASFIVKALVISFKSFLLNCLILSQYKWLKIFKFR